MNAHSNFIHNNHNWKEPKYPSSGKETNKLLTQEHFPKTQFLIPVQDNMNGITHYEDGS